MTINYTVVAVSHFDRPHLLHTHFVYQTQLQIAGEPKFPGFVSEKIENPQIQFFKSFGGFLPKSRSNHNLLGSIAGARRDTVLSVAALATSDGTESRNLAVNCTVVAS